MFIGLVGKSCSGKNYIGQILQDKGYEVWDLDELCHQALEEEENVRSVAKAFGPQVLDGASISRKALGRIVFENPAKRAELENILYPWLVQKIRSYDANARRDAKPKEKEPVVFLNGALLRRSSLDSYCKFIVYVDAPYKDRMERACSRDGITEQAFEKREAAQKDVDFRENHYKSPIFVINNNKETKNLELIRQINIICDRIENDIQQGE